MAFRGRRANNMADPFANGRRKMKLFANTIGGANQPETKAAANVLRRAVKDRIKVQGAGESSPAGQSPFKQDGKLIKGIGSANVGGIRRVGSGFFTAPLLEFGAIIGVRYIRPRPFFRPALEAATKEMTNVFVKEVFAKGLAFNSPLLGRRALITAGSTIRVNG